MTSCSDQTVRNTLPLHRLLGSGWTTFPHKAEKAAGVSSTAKRLDALLAGNGTRIRWLMLLLAVALAYAPALTGSFVWDDQALIQQNVLIRSPTLVGEAFRHGLFPEDSFSLHYRPLQTLTLIADYWCWGFNPFGYHLTNLFLQALAAILLYQLLRCLLAAPNLRPTGAVSPRWADSTAFGVALLWAVHPANNAAVAYIAGRADPLSFSLAAAGGLAFFRAGRAETSLPGDIFWTALGGVAMLGALLSREVAMCWIILFAGYFCIVNRPHRRRTWALGGGVVLAALGAYLLLRQPALATATLIPIGGISFDPPSRLLLAIRALGTYAEILLWPARLLLDRTLGCENELLQPGASGQAQLWLTGGTLGGLGALAVLVLGVVRCGHGWRLRWVGTGWFLVSFLPVSNFISLNATVADHWLYLPSVGLLLVGAGWWQEVSQPQRLALARPLLILAALLLGGRNFVRSFDWRDDVTFYTRTVAAGGGSARMRYNLALAKHGAGDPGAEAAVRAVLAQFPMFFPARMLADRLRAQREHEAPVARAARLRTWRENSLAKEHPDKRTRQQFDAELIRTLTEAGEFSEALTLLDDSVVDPAAAAARWKPVLAAKTDLLRRVGRDQEALSLTHAFVRTHPWHQESAFRLADLQSAAGDDVGALSTLAQADRLDVHGEGALQRMAAIYARRGDLTRALDCQQAAVTVAPSQADSHRRLGLIFVLLQREEAARREFALADHLETISSHILDPASHPPVGENIAGAIPSVRRPTSSPSSQLSAP